MIPGLKPPQVAEQQHLRDLLASGLIQDYSLAIDGGAHLGGWTRIMAAHFAQVVAFEPSAAFEQLRENCADLPNVQLMRAALMARHGKAACTSKPGRAITGLRFAPDAHGEVPALAIDDLGLTSCGLLKLDVEGCEWLALNGARQTIARCRPFIMCEMAGFKHDYRAERLLRRMGYRLVFERGVDKGFSL